MSVNAVREKARVIEPKKLLWLLDMTIIAPSSLARKGPSINEVTLISK